MDALVLPMSSDEDVGGLGLGLSFGGLERRVTPTASASSEPLWERGVDDYFGDAGSGGSLGEIGLEDMGMEMDEGEIAVSGAGEPENLQVDFNGEIVGAQEDLVGRREGAVGGEGDGRGITGINVFSGRVKSEPVEIGKVRYTEPREVKKEPMEERTGWTQDDRKLSLKEKRALEARMFPKELLRNLDGTTSAQVRKMNTTERDLVLFKRKLRNRESARRSRIKRQATLAELQAEVDAISAYVEKVVISAIGLKKDNERLSRQLEVANAELRAWRAVYPEAKPMSQTLQVGG